MTSVGVAITIFCCLFAGALVGMGLRTVIPQHQLDADTRDLIKLGVGLIGTMSALVLGLLVASTKGAYDTEKSELAQIAGNVILLDRVLSHYGGESADTRAALRTTVAGMMGGDGSRNRLEQLGRPGSLRGEVVFDKLQDLVPHTDGQKDLLAQAKSLAISLG